MKTSNYTSREQRAAKVAALIFNSALIIFGIWYIVKTFIIVTPQL